ncbi:MAG: prolipoprotein diacylglyceryl transferase family protein, partial [Planctomycetota bacterium]
TVLGGLLGGWLAVEAWKWRAGVRLATGGDFALPLAMALACGRIGCWFAGCCAGAPCADGWLATTDAAGVPRFPVQLLEAAFHFVAVVVLAVLAKKNVWPAQRLGAYLACYAAVRFVLEFRRQHPPVALGLSWHQFLALALFALAGTTWWRRRHICPAARMP